MSNLVKTLISGTNYGMQAGRDIINSNINFGSNSDNDPKACLRSLFVPGRQTAPNIKRITHGTCTWLPEHTQYKLWLESGGALWIRGRPGSGKSTLMGFITSMDQRNCTEGEVVISFFYCTGDSECGDISTILYRSLLHRLLSRDEELLHQFEIETKFRARIANEGNIDRIWDGHELQLREQCEVVFNACMAKGKKVRIYLDKIDELQEGDAKEVLTWLRQLSTEYNHSVNICFASTPFIREGLLNNFIIDVERENAGDIRRHLNKMFLLSSGLRKQADIEALKVAVAKRTEGNFQWLVCNTNDLQNMTEGGEAVAAVLSGVNVLPTELKDAYERLLNKVVKLEKVDLAFRILVWIVYAERPLPIRDLKYATCLDPSKSCIGCPPVHHCEHWHDNDNVFADRIFRILRCFLASGPTASVETVVYEEYVRRNPDYESNSEPDTVTAGAICPGDSSLQFNHESVHHFMVDCGLAMLDSRRSVKSIPRSLGSIHLAMARTSLQHLLTGHVLKFVATRARPDEDLPELSKDSHQTAKAMDAPPFTFYAARYWQEHILKAEINGASELRLTELLVPIDVISWGAIARAIFVSLLS